MCLLGKMETSYEKIGEQVTELKLDHRDGKLESPRLTEFLGKTYLDRYMMIYIYI